MHFVIAGKVNCQQFVYATMIAQRLKEKLPNFTYLRIAKKAGDWETWLIRTCKENEWYHIKSPIIWREISMIRGKKYYVGDISKFLDLCQDYYGMTRDMLTGELFDKVEIDWFARRLEEEYFEEVKIKAKEHVAHRCRQVCILGAGCRSCDVLVMELLHIPLQRRENGLEIRLYDEPRREKKLEAMALDARHCLGPSGLGSCRVAKNMREALYNVDLVIVLDSFPRRTNESLVKWLKRNRNAMCILGNALNKYARTHCRVIIGSPSNQPICYNATVLASIATKLHVRNIVVVTQDLGRETLTHLAKTANVDLKDLYCPPVWGFIGLNKCIDLRNTLYNYAYKVPGPRITMHLPQGTEEMEIRTVEPLITDKDINNIFMTVVNRKAEIAPRLGRMSQLAKITAILDLLKVWGIKQEDGGGEILSLGVYSDGTFNIPEGLYWSQPVTLEKGFWKPFARYPIPRRLDINIQNFFILGLASIVATCVKLRIHRDPKPVPKVKKPKKFDVEILAKGIKLPVIRIQSECLKWLKHLAKEELNLDLDVYKSMTISAITEESLDVEMEEVPLQELYCECWRQELLMLRKMISVRSSTTEVEVDLSENLSGSEFSVISPSIPYVDSGSLGSLKGSSEPGDVPLSGTVTMETSSGSVVCNCGDECHCLQARDSSEKSGEREDEETLSDKSYGQGCQVSDQDDVQDATNQGTFVKKTVKFDALSRVCRGKSRKFGFYGTKDAIVDADKRAKMRRRIRRYEGREDSSEESDQAQASDMSTGTEDYTYVDAKFHVSIDDNYEIIGDPDGLEALEEMRKSPVKDSKEGFAEMWADEVIPSIQVLSVDSGSHSTTMDLSHSEGQQSREGSRKDDRSEEIELPAGDYGEEEQYAIGEGEGPFSWNLEVIPEEDVEEEEEEEEEVQTPRDVVPAVDESEKVVEPPEVPKRKWEGVPKCCLCHCIVPEGEPGCHCGERKVMEVFKKSSMMLIPESEGEIEEGSKGAGEEAGEDELSFVVKSWQGSGVHSDSTTIGLSEVESAGGRKECEKYEELLQMPEEKEEKKIPPLPPESFFPFSPKLVNKFMAPERPPELCPEPKQWGEEGLPPECQEVFEEAEKQALQECTMESMAITSSATEYEMQFEIDESKVILDNTVPPAFHPTEDWRTSLMRKYREWFELGGDIKDEFYYDMAAEEVSSDDDCEADRELRVYFEN